jgi:hypothetical protein
MIEKLFSKMMWVGRATVFLVGLAVMLALVFGVAVTALAGTGVGATFNIGKTNTVNAVSRLVGSVAGSSLVIDNNSTGAGAAALDLQVELGKAPMKVNRTTKVANLNADLLDSKDSTSFFSSTYTVQEGPFRGTANQENFLSATCDSGDRLLSGGYAFLAQNGTYEATGNEVFLDDASNNTYFMYYRSDGTPDDAYLIVTCADLGQPHQAGAAANGNGLEHLLEK